MPHPEIGARYKTLEDKVRAYHPSPDTDLLRKSFEFADRMHEGQNRSSGHPYVTHPIAVADIIADLKLDVPSLCAGLLHDVVEDTLATVEQLQKEFDDEIAFLVDGVTKLSKMRFNTKEERQAETIRKMIVAMSRDIRVVLVKLADRVHNMRTLEHLDINKQKRIAQETLDVYAPLANRFGINWVKVELEDAALRYLHPDAYYALAEHIRRKKKERERYIRDVVALLRRVIEENGLKAELQGRPKHFYSIWQKMQDKALAVDQVYDILGFRIIVEEKFQCYEALGVVHNLWKPIPARFKDYIAMPKPNGYQSLHTSVIGPYREPIEIQIRTREMHRIAEEGVAAHWIYKEGRSGVVQDVSKFTWLRQLIEDFQEVSDHRDFMDRLKLDLFSEEVFVFTPRGDIRAFPAGATVVDFAYSIHTEIGDHCAGAKVNGVMVPLSHQLQSGDVVEIITRSSQRPNKDWLEHVKTGRARSKIRHFLRTEARQKATEIGRELLEAELRKHGLQLKTLVKKGQIKDAVEAVKLQSLDEVLMKLGYGVLNVRTVLKALIPDLEEREQQAEAKDQAPSALGSISQRVRKFFGKRSGVRIDGIDDDLLVRYARCCNPVPGEEIVGFVTRGRGLTVHGAACPHIEHLEEERQIEVHWDTKAVRDEQVTRIIRVEVISEDTRGLLAEMSAAFSTSGVNISEAHCRTMNGRAVNTFDLVVTDHQQLERAMSLVQRVPGVIKVSRVRG